MEVTATTSASRITTLAREALVVTLAREALARSADLLGDPPDLCNEGNASLGRRRRRTSTDSFGRWRNPNHQINALRLATAEDSELISALPLLGH
jgi:hypothetical protein